MEIKERVVIFDLEATCEENDKTYPKEIIEIGAIDNEGKEFSAFIKPIQRPILTDFCKKLTTINQEQVDEADGFNEVYPEFYEYFNGATLISWGAYDKNQLLKDLRLNKSNLGKAYIEANHINLKELFHEKMGYFPRGMKGEMRKLKIPMTGTHHRGIDDARNIMKIYNFLISK